MAFQMPLVRDGSLDGSWGPAKGAEPYLTEDDLPTEVGEDTAPLTAHETFTWYSDEEGSTDAPEDPCGSRAAAIARRADKKKTVPPVGSPGHVPSLGSLGHALDECRPCAWFHKSSGCHYGADCEHCHICGPNEHQRRKAAKVAAKRKEQREARQAQQAQPTPEPQPLSLPPPLPLSLAAALGETEESRPSLPSISRGSATWSIGSAGHGAGKCEPCAWFWKPQGCLRGADCLRCHACPDGEVLNRKRAKLAQLRTDRGGAASRSKATVPEEQQVTAGEPEAPPTTGSLSVEMVWPRAPPGLPAPEEQRATAGKPEAPTTTDTLSAEVVSPRAPPGPPAPPGLEAPSGLRRPEASEGSAGHWLGECEPCAWFWKPGGCARREACLRCHLCPDGTIKAIKRAKKDLRRRGSGADEPGQSAAALDRDQPAPEEPQGAEEQHAARTAAAPEEEQQDTGEPEATTGPLLVEVLAPRAPPGLCLPPVLATSSSGPQDLGLATGPPEAPSGPRQPEASEGSAGHRLGEREPCAPPGLLLPPVPAPSGARDLGLATRPRQPEASEGSAGHWLGECEPCAWFWKPGGCSHGAACRRCHLCPDGTVQRLRRAKKGLRRGGGSADDREPAAAGFQPPPGLPAPRRGLPEAL